MKRILPFIVATLLVCAHVNKEQDFPTHGIDPILKPYVDKFETLGKKYKGPSFKVPELTVGFGSNLNMQSSRDGYTVVGFCIPGLFTKPYIVLKKQNWIDSDEDEREELIFHELGHCLLDRDHLDTKINNIPISIMYSTVHDGWHYHLFREEYLEELFTESTSKILHRLENNK